MIHSLKVRITLLLLLCLAAVTGFGWGTFSNFIAYHEKSQRLLRSVAIVETAEQLASSTGNSRKNLGKLKNWKKKLEKTQRREAIGAFIRAHRSDSPQRVEQKLSFLIKSEKAYRDFLRPHLSYMEERLIYFGGISAISAFISLFLIYWFVWRGVFRPVDELSQKMIDFLNDRFSYEFSVPSRNEVGQLHSTFNSLAHRVLTNMEELKALDHAKSEFLSISSHELRTPLTSIKGSLGLLRGGVGGELSPKAKDLTEIAEIETDRLIRLINDLLDLAKIDAHKLPLEKKWTSLYSIAESTVRSLEGLANTANVQLEVKEWAKVEVYMDADRIQQVLTNLVSNAIKHSPKNTKVRVRAIVDEQDEVVIAVQDQGPGISPEDQEHIFESFRQVTSAESPLVKGTGLGLAIAKALVEEHDGSIGVFSKPGEGSTFYFSLKQWRSLEKSQLTHSSQKPAMEAS